MRTRMKEEVGISSCVTRIAQVTIFITSPGLQVLSHSMNRASRNMSFPDPSLQLFWVLHPPKTLGPPGDSSVYIWAELHFVPSGLATKTLWGSHARSHCTLNPKTVWASFFRRPPAGITNYVFIVEGPAGGLFVKQYPPFVRLDPERCVDQVG